MSSETSGAAADLRAVSDVSRASGVPHGEALLAFADALVGEDDARLESARKAVLEALGPAGLVDAAGVASNLERMVRIADGTGIPLEARVRLITGELRDELELDDFRSAANTPAPTPAQRLVGRALRPFTCALVRRFFRRAGR